jgi:hypothetical protein
MMLDTTRLVAELGLDEDQMILNDNRGDGFTIVTFTIPCPSCRSAVRYKDAACLMCGEPSPWENGDDG